MAFTKNEFERLERRVKILIIPYRTIMSLFIPPKIVVGDDVVIKSVRLPDTFMVKRVTGVDYENNFEFVLMSPEFEEVPHGAEPPRIWLDEIRAKILNIRIDAQLLPEA